MAEFASVSVADQIGLRAGDPVQLVDPPGVFLVTGWTAQPPNSVVEIEGGYICWLAPDRSLAVTGTPPGGFVSDITQGQAIFRLAEAVAADLLAMGGTLPLTALTPGLCAQTLFAGQKVLLYRRDGLIHLHIERALAAWLLAWFRQAATAL